MSVSVTRFGKVSEHGSALVLVCVILVFAGFVFSLGLGSFATQGEPDKIQLTAKKQQFLINQLSAYAQRENKIPCPADSSVNPALAAYGFARNANWAANPNDPGSCGTGGTGSSEGIVPFRTLGLEEYDVIDGWGRLMTYRISPVMNNPVLGTTLTTANIFMRCRRFPWFDDGVKVYQAGYYNTHNTYPEKAVFCCPPSDGTFDVTHDLKILPTAASVTTINSIGRSTIDYAPIDTITGTGYDLIPPADGTQEVFAFAIISHGSNGAGAFVAGSGARLGGTAGTDEQVNYGADPLKVVDHPMVLTPGANYFDDMVVWRTQIGLMSELGNVSCYMPWR